METNTVVISVERYEELREAEEKLKLPRSKTIIVKSYFPNTYRVETDDDSAEKLAKDLKKSMREAKQLRRELVDLKRMSLWNFYKWKRNK